MRIRRAIAVLGAAVVLTGLAACSTRPPPDEVWLFYKAGPTEATKFSECIPANVKGPAQVNNNLYAIPTNGRTWNIQPQGTPGADDNTPIRIGTKPTMVEGVQQPGPEVHVWVNADFFIRTFCGKDNKDPNSPVVRFWETLGRRYHVSNLDGSGEFDAAGWKELVNAIYLPSLKSAIQTAGRKYEADTLDADTGGAWAAMERELSRTLMAGLKGKPGGEFLCGAQYANDNPVKYRVPQIDPISGAQLLDAAGKPLPDVDEESVCPPIKVDITAIDYADARVQEARAGVYAAKQEAEAKLTRARADKAASDLVKAGGKDSIEIQRLQAEVEMAKACASNPNCTLILGANSNTNVNVGK